MSYLFNVSPPIRLEDSSSIVGKWWEGSLIEDLDRQTTNNTEYQKSLILFVKALITYGHHLIKQHLYCQSCNIFIRHEANPEVHKSHLLVFGKVQHDALASAWRSSLNREYLRLVKCQVRGNEVSLNLLMQEYLVFISREGDEYISVFEREMFSPHIHLLAQLEVIIQKSARECLIKDHIGSEAEISREDATVMLGLQNLGKISEPVKLEVITRCQIARG